MMVPSLHKSERHIKDVHGQQCFTATANKPYKFPISLLQSDSSPTTALHIYYIKLKSCLSVWTILLISQPCMHRLKRDLLEMKDESSGMTKFVLKSLNVRLVIHTSAQKALV